MKKIIFFILLPFSIHSTKYVTENNNSVQIAPQDAHRIFLLQKRQTRGDLTLLQKLKRDIERIKNNDMVLRSGSKHANIVLTCIMYQTTFKSL